MRQSSQYIILAGAFTGVAGSLYFLSLLLHSPFAVTIILVLASLYLLHRWIIDSTETAVPVNKQSNKKEWLLLVVLALGMAILSINSVFYGMKYGGYDASAIWNFHAQYLTDPDNWQKLFQNIAHDHVDYPLAQPAIIAFFMRVLATSSTVLIPFAFCALVSFSIPMLVYQEVARKHMGVAIATMLLFVSEVYYIMSGVSQYADILVAFFFLCAFVCASYMQQDKKYIMLSAFFLAASAWTKNEGAVLGIIFFTGYGKQFCSRKNIMYTISGMALPLTALLLLKIRCGVQNDLVRETNADLFAFLVNGDRYATIFNAYLDTIRSSFSYTTVGFCIYAVAMIVMRKNPGRQFYILLACMAAYTMVYVITPKDLAWHLATSQSRLMLQLMPALVYVMAKQLAELPYKMPKWVRGKKEVV